MTISRRTLFKRAGSAGALALVRPGLIGSAVLGSRAVSAAPPLANAVEFIQGTASKLGSVILADATALKLPISANRMFFSTAYQLQKYLPSDYPGKFSIIGLSDALGHPSFAVNMLPPSNFIPGSTINPSLQILLSSDTHYTNFVSMVFPDFITLNKNTPSDWRTLQIAVGSIPGTSPARWFITAVDIDQEHFAVNIPSMGYFTDPMGEAPLPSQVPPVVFNFQTTTNGMSGNINALWIGQPMTSKVGGYKPVGGNDNWLDSTPMRITQTYLNLTPTKNVNLGITATQFVNASGVVQPLLASISGSTLDANTAEETINQYIRTPQTATYTAASGQLTALNAALAASANAAQKAGASTLTQLALGAASTYSAQASAALGAQNPAGAVQNLGYVQQYLADAQTAAAEGQAAGGGIATSIPINPNTNTAIVSSAGSAPQVYMSGTGATTTQVSTGNVVAGSSGSYYQNQVDGGVSLSTPSGVGVQPAVQSPDDSYMTIESVDVTSE